MQTDFSAAQLADPQNASSAGIIRKCVHCGFCTATCPTYLLLGNELDSPRGRIYLMKEMLEAGGAPSASTVKHVDRCLSCLSCATTCPSGVDYMHLVDHARAHIEAHYRRPWRERLMRDFLSFLLPRPALFRTALRFAALGRLLRPLLPSTLHSMVELAPEVLPKPDAPGRAIYPAAGARRARVAILAGCVQSVIGPQINAAAIRLMNRLGVEVVVARGAGCCGALSHHLGKSDASHALASANIAAWTAEMDGEGLDAIVVTASGCGTAVKDYGFMFRDDPRWAEPAARVSAKARDIAEFLQELGDPPVALEARPLRVAYQSACSLQHGQGVRDAPKDLLRAYGFTVVEPAEAHICCGSAGAYNILQPEIAGQLRARKAANLEATRPDVVATGNIGCMTQIAQGIGMPVVHTVELLDWASGGPAPSALTKIQGQVNHRP